MSKLDEMMNPDKWIEESEAEMEIEYQKMLKHVEQGGTKYPTGILGSLLKQVFKAGWTGGSINTAEKFKNVLFAVKEEHDEKKKHETD